MFGLAPAVKNRKETATLPLGRIEYRQNHLESTPIGALRSPSVAHLCTQYGVRGHSVSRKRQAPVRTGAAHPGDALLDAVPLLPAPCSAAP